MSQKIKGSQNAIVTKMQMSPKTKILPRTNFTTWTNLCLPLSSKSAGTTRSPGLVHIIQMDFQAMACLTPELFFLTLEVDAGCSTCVSFLRLMMAVTELN